jgi:hypothetical protein
MTDDNENREETPSVTAILPFEVPRVAVNEPLKPIKFDVPLYSDVAPVIVTPQGYTVHPLGEVQKALQQAQPKPLRRKGGYYAADLPSFLAWMKENCDDSAPVFAAGAETLATAWRSPRLVLIGIGNYSGKDKAEWHDFGCQYNFPVTAAWNAWGMSNNTWMSQEDFAEFVEAHLYEFSAPASGEELGEAIHRMIEALGGTRRVGSPSVMIELANGVKLTVHEKVEVALDRSSGEAELKYTEEHTGKGGRPTGIPKFFYIRIPVFFGQEARLIGALLRYRNVGGGQVKWSYELFAPDLVVQDAFHDICNDVLKANRTLYLGTPDMPGNWMPFMPF